MTAFPVEDLAAMVLEFAVQGLVPIVPVSCVSGLYNSMVHQVLEEEVTTTSTLRVRKSQVPVITGVGPAGSRFRL